jgi:hypothetical protein
LGELAAFQLADVFAQLGVGGDEVRDPLLEGSGLAAQRLLVELDPQERRELLDERQRSARVRCGIDVVRQARPQARHLDAVTPQAVGEHTHDPGGSLVAGGQDPELREQPRAAREARHAHRSRVHHVGHVGTEQDDLPDPQSRRELGDELDEAVPMQVGLDAEADHELARRVDRTVTKLGERPFDDLLLVVRHTDRRAVHRVVDELLAVDLRQGNRLDRLIDEAKRRARGFTGVVPTFERHDERRVPQRRVHVHPEFIAHGPRLTRRPPMTQGRHRPRAQRTRR